MKGLMRVYGSKTQGLIRKDHITSMVIMDFGRCGVESHAGRIYAVCALTVGGVIQNLSPFMHDLKELEPVMSMACLKWLDNSDDPDWYSFNFKDKDEG